MGRWEGWGTNIQATGISIHKFLYRNYLKYIAGIGTIVIA